MRLNSRIAFFASLALFLSSALFGALISYNQTVAWQRFVAIGLGVGLCLLFAWMPERMRFAGRNGFAPMRVILALLPTALLIYFFLTNDWTARLGKVVWLDPILGWFASWQPQLPGLAIDSNSLGGVLAMLIPLQVSALRNSRFRIGGMSLLVVSFAGLLLSQSRGAWLALGAIAWVWAVWYVTGLIVLAPRARQGLFLASVAAIALLSLVLLSATSLGEGLLTERSDRWIVWRNSVDLVSDYPFTGIGLGAFTMAYSSYVLLVHVPHTIHAHNLFLDIWLEQGLLGLLTFVALVLIGMSNSLKSPWRVAALASVGVIVLHGFLDDTFYGYGGNALALLLLPFGILARDASSNQVRVSRWFIPASASVIALVALIVVFVPSTRAMIEANLGALLQTRTELSLYSQAEWQFQDRLRRSPTVNLNGALEHFHTALALDPANATANRRLGQIALSRGEYTRAREYLQAAYASAPEHSATRLLLGELYAIEGEIEQASMLWKNLDTSAGQLQVRLWWYEYLGDREKLQSVTQAARLARKQLGGEGMTL